MKKTFSTVVRLLRKHGKSRKNKSRRKKERRVKRKKKDTRKKQAQRTVANFSNPINQHLKNSAKEIIYFLI